MSFTGGYKLPKNWELSTRWRYAGSTPYVPVDTVASLAAYPEIILDYDRLGDLTLTPFSIADLRIDKKWNFKKTSFNFYFEIQNFLAQPNPSPPSYGLARDSEGVIITPQNLVQVSAEEENSVPLPSFGFVLYF